MTVIKTWLDLDGSADAFFVAFQQQASKRRAIPDRSSLTIYLKTEQNQPDHAAYPLELDEVELDADWSQTVKWLEKNKREHPPHIFGTIPEGD